MKLTEQEVQNELQKLVDRYNDEPKLPGAKSLYLGSGWFSDKQVELLLQSAESLLQNPTVSHVHIPLLFQFEGNAYSETGEFEPDFEWAQQTFKADERAIYNTDITIGVFEAENVDSGTSVELGIARSSHKPVVALYDGDLEKNPINLMISFGADSYVLTPEEFKEFNFMDIEPRSYKGKII